MPPKKKAAAAAAAHSAAKKRGSQVQINATVEDSLRTAVAALPAQQPIGKSPKQQLSKEELLSRAVDVYSKIMDLGFQSEDAAHALQELRHGAMELEDALDWLCLHVPASQLPKQFQGISQVASASGKASILARAAPQPAASKRQASTAAAAPAKPAPKPAESAAEKAAKAAKAAAALERDRQSQKDWMRRYMEQQSESEEDDDGKSDGVIEDWELFADPKEIERRKAERKRQALPLQERQQILASEWVEARSRAAKAKSANDKSQQKAMGQVIRNLKLEMAQLGLTEDECTAMGSTAEEEEPLVAPEDDEGSWPELGGTAPTQSKDQTDSAPSDGHLSPSQETANGSAPAQSNGSAADGEAGEGAELGMGLFNEEEDSNWQGPQPTKPSRTQVPQMWGSYGSSARAQQVKKGSAKPSPPVQLRQPKAVLQQHCQQSAWGPPKFEKLTPGGERLAIAGIRYSVAIALPREAKGGKKQRGLHQKSFQLAEHEDGWETINDAQNAVATRVLYEMLGASEGWKILPEPFSSLWLSWDESSQSRQPAQAASSHDDHVAYIRSLVLPNQPDGASTAAAPQSAPAAPQSAPAAELAAGNTHLSNGKASKAAEHVQQPSAANTAQEQQQQRQSIHMREAWQAWKQTADGQHWQEQRGSLPVTQIRAAALEALAASDFVVVMGDTGSGKTTQVPQYILEDSIEHGTGAACNIVCTQPRRIAAISVAERVANERGMPAPGRPGSHIGYHVRLDAATTQDTRLLFCTTGILLRRLSGDAQLLSVSHVVVDEVHERTLQGDFLMALLRDLVHERRKLGKPLKVILMSATLDARLFSTYLGGCPVVAAGGRTFPVQHLFLENAYEMTGYLMDPDSPAAYRIRSDKQRQKQLQKQTVSQQHLGLVQEGWGDDAADAAAANPHFSHELYKHLSKSARRNLAMVDETIIDYELVEAVIDLIDAQHGPGAVLVFLPGIAEISKVVERLTATASTKTRRWIVPLHSSVSSAEQRQAFSKPPHGVRKIVIATNIAETSLTIADVCFVIDAGRLKERRHDASRGMGLLVEDWVSRASALQRKGRAGRVQEGICFSLFTKQRFEHQMRKFQAPEMVRVPLEELVLQIHLLKLGPANDFLQQVLEPPPAKSIEGALAQLQSVGALTKDEQLTPLGYHLAQLPVDARMGKLLVVAALLGCLAPALTVAACLSHKSPFSAPVGQQDQARRAMQGLAASGTSSLASGQQSDHLLMIAAFDGWQAAKKQGRNAQRSFAQRNFLSEQTLEMISDMRNQFGSMLADTRLLARPAKGFERASPWIDDQSKPWNIYAKHVAVVKAALCSALYPNIAVMEDGPDGTRRPAWNDGHSEVAVHPSSINHMLAANQFQRPYQIYLEKVKTSKVFMRDCTVVAPMALLLFGGSLDILHQSGYVQIDGWLKIKAAAPLAVLVKQLRQALESVLERRISSPAEASQAADLTILQQVATLLNDEERQLGARA